VLLSKHSYIASIRQEFALLWKIKKKKKVRIGVNCMDKIRNDGAFLAGLTSGVLGSYGISVNKKKPTNAAKIVDNKDTNVGIK